MAFSGDETIGGNGGLKKWQQRDDLHISIGTGQEAVFESYLSIGDRLNGTHDHP